MLTILNKCKFSIKTSLDLYHTNSSSSNLSLRLNNPYEHTVRGGCKTEHNYLFEL